MPHKILIVDDEPNIVISLEFLMQQSGYEVETARDGEEALQKIVSFQPDLVLLDIMLPQLNGFEVCQRIRENSQWNRIKVIMLSAKGREIEISKGIALGADAYVTKPFSTKDLIVQVQRLLAGE
ncbi:response regulator transcription factor [Herminiimonas sp. CN]|uniref:response regulator transcription factor n=1 Tax=Herminiimonas sp. CN TaxID=1349818 RepID=UPI00047385A2|nr:response regulator [Herminiimonas sp. CN]